MTLDDDDVAFAFRPRFDDPALSDGDGGDAAVVVLLSMSIASRDVTGEDEDA